MEWRSAGLRATFSVTGMDLTIDQAFLPHDDPDAALVFSRDTLGFERLQAGDAEVVQEPTDQPWGIRDCALRDPAGNLIRIFEVR
jgi:uncharacterized glyoxalase superfamily protein PhnB